MKLKTVKRDGINECAYIVTDSDEKPVDHISWFTVNELSKWANSTQQAIARNVLHIEKWANVKGLNLTEEFDNSCLSDDKKYKSLVKHLERFTGDTGEVVPLAVRVVSPKYFNDRIDSCVLYFDYLVRRGIEKRRSDDKMVSLIEDRFKKLKAKLVDERRAKDEDSSKHGLTQSELNALLIALNEPEIFGWSKATTLRNQLIIRLFLSTGIRKSELLALNVKDCVTTKLREGKKAHIIVQQNVQEDDPREQIPHVKTRSRIIVISDGLKELINEYKTFRQKFRKANAATPYLFLSSHFPYPPLAISSVDSIFTSIKATLPDIKTLGSHRLRHTFFENFDRTLHRENYSDDLRKKLANSLGGWSRKSNTRLNYQTLATEEQCEEALSAMHAIYESDFDQIPF